MNPRAGHKWVLIHWKFKRFLSSHDGNTTCIVNFVEDAMTFGSEEEASRWSTTLPDWENWLPLEFERAMIWGLTNKRANGAKE